MISPTAISSSYTATQFAFFRIVFGTYLTIHFLYLLPDASELFSHSGVLAEASLNFTYPLTFFNPLAILDTPSFVTIWVFVCMILSILFACGWKREWIALFLWFGWACLFNRNNLISNPSIPYAGMLLLLTTLIPSGEPMRLDQKTTANWQMPSWILLTSWILLAVGYTFSGLDKLASPSWLDGSAMTHLLNNPLARPGWLRDFMLSDAQSLLPYMTWFVLAAEILFLPLCVFRTTRHLIWLIFIGMHCSILLLLDFADLSFGMLMIHWFTFEPVRFRVSVRHAQDVKIPQASHPCGIR